MDVTRANKGNGRSKVRNISRDKHVFSNTADKTHVMNTMTPGRPMRGGIRL